MKGINELNSVHQKILSLQNYTVTSDVVLCIREAWLFSQSCSQHKFLIRHQTIQIFLQKTIYIWCIYFLHQTLLGNIVVTIRNLVMMNNRDYVLICLLKTEKSQLCNSFSLFLPSFPSFDDFFNLNRRISTKMVKFASFSYPNGLQRNNLTLTPNKLGMI